MKMVFRSFALIMLAAGILLLSIAPAMAETPKPTDVPPDHWAYKAVVSLVEKGYLTYFQDGSFKGNAPVDRFNLAVVVAKILNEVALGNKPASREDMALLRKLTNEFQDELVALSTKVNLFDERLTYLENGYKQAQDDAAKAEDEYQKTQEQAKQVISEILTLKTRVESIEGKQKLQDAELGAVRDRLSKVENEVKKLKTWSIITTILAVVGIFV
ncbi:MAG TPA: S-layer homology domain-containing protein [Bacillota bacterium]|nr:S-layer homology domain-containing protein [Bacillota bacterium]